MAASWRCISIYKGEAYVIHYFRPMFVADWPLRCVSCLHFEPNIFQGEMAWLRVRIYMEITQENKKGKSLLHSPISYHIIPTSSLRKFHVLYNIVEYKIWNVVTAEIMKSSTYYVMHFRHCIFQMIRNGAQQAGRASHGRMMSFMSPVI